MLAKKKLREKQYEAFNRVINDLPREEQDSQVIRNLRIVLSPEVPRNSLRSTVAVYRLIELGVDETKINELMRTKPDVLLRWFRVKEALCLSDSSCGLREFFL